MDTGSGTSGGIRLTQGQPILYEIAQYFTNIDCVMALAVYLLHGIGMGGRAYVASLQGSVADKAHSVLEHWCLKKAEKATGAALYSILVKQFVCPQAAADFCSKLAPGKILLFISAIKFLSY